MTAAADEELELDRRREGPGNNLARLHCTCASDRGLSEAKKASGLIDSRTEASLCLEGTPLMRMHGFHVAL
eukprot:scaffold6036_cov371-Prasinococcus_capsulatus_cf.AAC.3